MHSKWQVWDFFKAQPNGISTSKGNYAFYFFNPIFQSFILDRIKENPNIKDQYRLITGPQCSKAWIEDNLLSLSLFGNTDHIIILKANELPKDASELLENISNTNERFLLFFFEQENTVFKKITANNNFISHSIEAPKFWDFSKLLDFMSSLYSVNLSFDTKNLFLDNIIHDPYEFATALSILKLNFPDEKEISPKQLTETVKTNRFDLFEIASLISKKQVSQFYEKLLLLENDFESIRSIFAFLQIHLIKIADPSYVAKKAKPSKYDKEIQTVSKLWKPQEITAVIRKFGQYEILAKQKKSSLFNNLKSDYLRSFYVKSSS